MLKQKSSLIIAVVVIMSLLVVAGTSSAEGIESWAEEVRANHEGDSITVAMASHPSTEAYQEMVEEFTELTGIEVEWDIMDEIYLHNRIMTEHAARTGAYDVLMMDVTWLGEFVDRNVVTSIDDYVAEAPDFFDYDDFVDAYAEGLGQYDDQIFGIPSAGESAFIAYREDVFEEHGISPEDINDFYDLLEVVSEVHNPDEDLYGISMRAARGHHNVYGWFQFLYPFGGSVFVEDSWEPAINSPESIASLEYFQSIMDYAPPGYENFSHEEATSTFQSGNAAIWFDATALAPWIEDEAESDVHDKVGYMAPPAGPEGRYAALAGWNLSVATHSDNHDAAWAFINYMTSKEMHEEYVDAGGVVTRESILTSEEYNDMYPYFSVINETLEYAYDLVEEGIEWRPRIPEWPEIGDVSGNQGVQALIGNKTAEEATNDAAERIYEIMEEAGYY